MNNLHTSLVKMKTFKEQLKKKPMKMEDGIKMEIVLEMCFLKDEFLSHI